MKNGEKVMGKAVESSSQFTNGRQQTALTQLGTPISGLAIHLHHRRGYIRRCSLSRLEGYVTGRLKGVG